MKTMLIVVSFVLVVTLTGCVSTSLDKAATRELDESVQKITKENDEYNKNNAALDKIEKDARFARNDSTRELARKMARAAGNLDLPAEWK